MRHIKTRKDDRSGISKETRPIDSKNAQIISETLCDHHQALTMMNLGQVLPARHVFTYTVSMGVICYSLLRREGASPGRDKYASYPS